MGPDLIATTAQAWALLMVAGTGIAILPWTDGELRATVDALQTIRDVLKGRRATP